jgi:DNA polymerase-3 subunit delta'
MAWQGIVGHDDVVERFRRALARGRLASSFLLVGPSGVGKRTFALKLAQAMLCLTVDEKALEPCNACESCLQAIAGSHPDIERVSKPDDRATIPLELFIGDQDHRRRVGLCHNISLRPFYGRRKVAIIDDADLIAVEGANSLLKTLEEPPPRSLLILVGTSPTKQLPTIRSRCQIVHFGALPVDEVRRLLLERSLVSDAAEAERLARHSGGSLQRAVELSDADLWTFRDELFANLAALDSVRLAPQVSQFVDAAGKEAPRRRARLRQVIGFAADFYRALLRMQAGGSLSGDATLEDPALLECVEQSLARAPSAEEAAARLDRCLTAAEHVDRNANQTTLIEAWLDSLAS